MEIYIEDINGVVHRVLLEDVGAVYKDDDVIYFNGEPFVLSTARPQ